jgi:hypothetical protein
MTPIVNLEENIGKTVGKRRPLEEDPFVAYERILRLGRVLRPRLPYPRGVFRFATHEDADAWQNSHILKAAASPEAAPRKGKT